MESWIKSSNKSGFSAVELVVVIGIIAALLSVVNVFNRALENQSELKASVLVISQAIHRARIGATTIDGDSNWGIKIQGNQAIVYKGTSYALRTTSFDEIYSLSQAATSTGTLEFNFTKFTGATNAGTTTLSFTSSTTVITASLFVNANGIVSY